MTRINISDLNSAGCQLFDDQESFLEELEEAELETIAGGYFNIGFSNISPLFQDILRLGVYNIQDSAYSNSVYSNTVYGNTVQNNTVNGKTSSNFNTVQR